MPVVLKRNPLEIEPSGAAENVVHLTFDKAAFEKQLDAAIRSTEKPIRPPNFFDFFRDISEALKTRSAPK